MLEFYSNIEKTMIVLESPRYSQVFVCNTVVSFTPEQINEFCWTLDDVEEGVLDDYDDIISVLTGGHLNAWPCLLLSYIYLVSHPFTVSYIKFVLQIGYPPTTPLWSVPLMLVFYIKWDWVFHSILGNRSLMRSQFMLNLDLGHSLFPFLA